MVTFYQIKIDLLDPRQTIVAETPLETLMLMDDCVTQMVPPIIILEITEPSFDTTDTFSSVINTKVTDSVTAKGARTDLRHARFEKFDTWWLKGEGYDSFTSLSYLASNSKDYDDLRAEPKSQKKKKVTELNF